MDRAVCAGDYLIINSGSQVINDGNIIMRIMANMMIKM